MRPFVIAYALDGLRGTYPDSTELIKAICSGKQSRTTIVKLWISEGIPHAFSDCPAIYEAVRTWLGKELNVHAKEISITGSARLGVSLSPMKFGERFDKQSDLDFFVVSDNFFNLLKNDFYLWLQDFSCGKVKAKNGRQQMFWSENANRGQNNFHKGFIDSKKIPSFQRYKIAQKTANSMWLLTEKLKSTKNAPSVSTASIRCYKSWDAAVSQISLNLSHISDFGHRQV